MAPEYWIDEYCDDDCWFDFDSYDNSWVSEIRQRFNELQKKKTEETKEKDITEFGFEEDLFEL